MAQNLETGLIINKLTGDTHTLTINGDISVTGLTTDISLLKISQPTIGLGTISATQDLLDPIYSGYTRIDGVDTNFTTSLKINENIISSGLTLSVVDIISDTLLYTLLDPLAFFSGETYTLDGLTRLESFNNGNFIVDNEIYIGKGRDNGFYSTAIGYKSLGGDDSINPITSTRGFGNTSIGYESSRYVIGDRNTSVGTQSLEYNTNSSSNTVFGYGSMRFGTGANNIGIGVLNLGAGGGGIFYNNVVIGNNILINAPNTTGITNSVLIGNGVLQGCFDSNENTAIGCESLFNGLGVLTFDGGISYYKSGMTHNTTVGTRTLYNSNYGTRNTAIGHESLYYLTDAHENTALGYNSGPPSFDYSGLTNTTCIGANSFVTKNDSVILGNPNDVNIMVGIGTPSPTSKLDISGLTGYDQLRLRTSYTPTGSTDSNGNIGDVAWDDNYFYWKTSTQWLRISGQTF
jgi:hypothetical protein